MNQNVVIFLFNFLKILGSAAILIGGYLIVDFLIYHLFTKQRKD